MTSVQKRPNVREYWNVYWETNNASSNFAQEVVSQDIVRGKDVAELFCGSIEEHKHLAGARSVKLIDVSDVALRMAREKAQYLRNTNAIVANSLHLPLRDNSVDTVVMLEGVGHTGKRFLDLFMEAIRVSRRYIAFTTIHSDHLRKYGARLVDHSICSLYRSDTIGDRVCFNNENLKLLMSRRYLDMRIKRGVIFEAEIFRGGLREEDMHVPERAYIEVEKWRSALGLFRY